MSSITFSLILPLQSEESDKARRHALSGIAAAITGLDPVRQTTSVRVDSISRTYEVTIHEALIPEQWINDAEALLDNELLSFVNWTGETCKASEPVEYQQGWKIVPEKTYTGAVTFKADTPMGAITVTTEWDGCTHLWIPDSYEALSEETCYHHIYDLDEFIAYLQAVREKARRFFGGDFERGVLSEQERERMIEKFQEEEKS